MTVLGISPPVPSTQWCRGQRELVEVAPDLAARQHGLDMMTMSLLTQAHIDLADRLPRAAFRNFAGALRLNPRRAFTLRAFKWFLFSPWDERRGEQRGA